MRDILKRVQNLIQYLPQKDKNYCLNFLNKRDFQSILEIVESDIYKAERKKEKDENYISTLNDLKSELLTYMSYLDIPVDEDTYDY